MRLRQEQAWGTRAGSDGWAEQAADARYAAEDHTFLLDIQI